MKQASQAGSRRKLPALPIDTEERHALVEKEGHIRDKIMYLTTSLVAWMEREWGRMFTHVKTSTNAEVSEVYVACANPDDPGAIPVRRIGAQNAIEFSFWRPLRKLGIVVPPDRQYNVKPFLAESEELGLVFVFPMTERVSVPRNVREEAEAKEGQKAPAVEQPASQ